MEALKKEELVRRIVSCEYGVTFTKRALKIGPRKILHEFDLVSEDGKVVGEVKTDKYTSPQTFHSTRFPRAMLDCRYLELADAEKRLIVFTDQAFYEAFVKKAQGLVMKPITVLYISLNKRRVEKRITLP